MLAANVPKLDQAEEQMESLSSLAANVALGIGLNPAVNQHQQRQIATGIIGTMFSPLGAARFAFGVFPQTMVMRSFCGLPAEGAVPPCQAPAAQLRTELTGDSTGAIDLGDGYTLQLDGRQGEITIQNAKTGEATRIWGDPQVDVDANHASHFWEATAFTLENGTRITITTKQSSGNPNAYVASQIVITNGSNAIVVEAISQNEIGDLTASLSKNRRGEGAAQTDLVVTRVGAASAPRSEALSLSESAQMMNKFLLFGSSANAMIASARRIMAE